MHKILQSQQHSRTKNKTEPRHDFGYSTEDRALDFYRTQDFQSLRLLERNYRRRIGEIDLIFEAGVRNSVWKSSLLLIFVEVRARHRGNGIESVTYRKRKRIEKVASEFLSHYRGSATGIRFDVLASDGRTWSFLPNAW